MLDSPAVLSHNEVVKMKTTLNLALAFSVFGIVLTPGTNCFAQTQTVTLAVINQNPQPPPASYAVATNQVVKIISIAGFASIWLSHSSGVTVQTTNSGTYTGLTNVSVYATYYSGNGFYGPGLVTLEITTPTIANVVSNYVPADAIVIPASATGNVQVILESSPDLVNWTAASPGTYGASAGTNRFFRVRAVVGP